MPKFGASRLLFWGNYHATTSTSGLLVVWGSVVWDSDRSTLKESNPFHFRGSNRNPNHLAPNHQLTISWQYLNYLNKKLLVKVCESTFTRPKPEKSNCLNRNYTFRHVFQVNRKPNLGVAAMEVYQHGGDCWGDWGKKDPFIAGTKIFTTIHLGRGLKQTHV